MAAVVAAVAAYFASLPQPSSGKYPGGSNHRNHKTPITSPLIDIRPYIKDIPESILQQCPEDLREHHLEHIWVPFCSVEFLDMVLLYKAGKITEEEFVLHYRQPSYLTDPQL